MSSEIILCKNKWLWCKFGAGPRVYANIALWLALAIVKKVPKIFQWSSYLRVYIKWKNIFVLNSEHACSLQAFKVDYLLEQSWIWLVFSGFHVDQNSNCFEFSGHKKGTYPLISRVVNPVI